MCVGGEEGLGERQREEGEGDKKKVCGTENGGKRYGREREG